MWETVYYTKARGVSFEGRQSLLLTLAPGDILTVVPEPHNPHHSAAHALYYRKAQIGYLPRKVVDDLSPDEYRAVVTQVTGGDEFRPLRGVNLRLEKKVGA